MFTDLFSPGSSVYFGHNADGGRYHYIDDNPCDGSGADLRGPDTVDAQGWTQACCPPAPGTVG
ncbi:hypothetical protein ALI22I_21120 [Saccharothrix sp. ALI-22-I]|uniref:hypothetical protein n=1 Tax=Saccharothrix sp. ALI-22-I TaxID=1933778 RepID=UPI00097C6FB9|nr:hypothetical protein [Saccharothrix sp. ALI-22-I]ONI87705.1 hypothetical protein ALI22I_21120 [Saccharothrix sp. ALI-22-I]